MFWLRLIEPKCNLFDKYVFLKMLLLAKLGDIGPESFRGAADELHGQADLLPDLLRDAAVTVGDAGRHDPDPGGLALADVVEQVVAIGGLHHVLGKLHSVFLKQFKAEHLAMGA